jgi:hypothetical protein
MYLGIFLSIVAFIIFYYFIKKEIICQCDDDTCDCFSKKNKMAVKYGILGTLFTFMTYLLIVYQNDILLTFFPPIQKLN